MDTRSSAAVGAAAAAAACCGIDISVSAVRNVRSEYVILRLRNGAITNNDENVYVAAVLIDLCTRLHAPATGLLPRR